VHAGVIAIAGGVAVSASVRGVDAMMAGAAARVVSVARRLRSDRPIGM